MDPRRLLESWKLVTPLALALVCLVGMGWGVSALVSRSAVPAHASGIAAYTVGLAPPASPTTLTAPTPATAPTPDSTAPLYQVPAYPVKPGFFIPPVGGWVSQPFGPTDFTAEPPGTYNGVSYPHFHTGIDIDAPLGTPVVASASGVVVEAGAEKDGQGNLIGYGNFVIIAHAHGFYTLYAHLERELVTQGQQVIQLQVIGLVGSTGLSTGPHVHFEIRRNGEFLDPLPYLLARLRA